MIKMDAPTKCLPLILEAAFCFSGPKKKLGVNPPPMREGVLNIFFLLFGKNARGGVKYTRAFFLTKGGNSLWGIYVTGLIFLQVNKGVFLSA